MSNINSEKYIWIRVNKNSKFIKLYQVRAGISGKWRLNHIILSSACLLGCVLRELTVYNFNTKDAESTNMRVSLNYIDLVVKNYELSKKFEKSDFSIDFTAHLMLILYTVCIILLIYTIHYIIYQTALQNKKE